MESKDARELGKAASAEAQGAEGAVEERAALLMEQAEAISAAGGPDMLEVFREDPTIREKVATGEWDFQVAYGYLLGRESAGGNARGRRGVPPAVRTPNNANTRRSVAGMSDQEFEALNERLSRGEVVDPGR